MEKQTDGVLNIAVGMSVNSKIWKNKQMRWSDLVSKLSEPNPTGETLKEYLSSSKDDQLRIKDVGGYVGGYLKNGRRKPENVVYRQILTLDMDFAYSNFWDDFCMLMPYSAVLHSTHKHSENSPRYRLIMPLSRECTPDEYVATARYIAGILDIDLFDRSTFETNRLMFWQSNPRDVEYYFRQQKGDWVDVDEILDSYEDWTDSSLWPSGERENQDIKDRAEIQKDPELKKGIVGAFCRAYPISEAIKFFLSDVYVPSVIEDRYTYRKGTTSSGLIVYDDKFAFSHHGSDPCGGKLSNSFDLVRIHKFGHLDSDKTTGKPKSFSEMEELARSDKKVRKLIAEENIQESKYDFAEDLEDYEAVEDEDIEWMQELDVDGKGNYISSSTNLNLIFARDIRFKNLFRYNKFDDKKYVFGNLPWRKIPKPEPIRNVDLSGVRNYIESIYGISGALKIEDALNLEFERNQYHPIRDYIRGLEWDEQERIDALLIDYFGAEDNIYTREAIRKTIVGGVARVFNPGIKFDLVLTLVSQTQGTGKSSFFKALGRDWFSDSFITVQGKEAFEQLQGAWIIEMAELAGLRKADIEATKHFISKQVDMFRPAYGRTVENYPRQCVFVGTTNESSFLRDPTGNRRFMPVPIWNVKLIDNPRLIEFIESPETVDQIWAEAYIKFRKGEKLYLSREAERIATIEQRDHTLSDDREGLVEKYLNTKLPENWDGMDIYERRSFLNDPLSPNGENIRTTVCIAEIWCECLGREKEDMDRYKTRDLNEIMRSLPGWVRINSTKNFGFYGKQKYFEKK